VEIYSIFIYKSLMVNNVYFRLVITINNMNIVIFLKKVNT